MKTRPHSAHSLVRQQRCPECAHNLRLRGNPQADPGRFSKGSHNPCIFRDASRHNDLLLQTSEPSDQAHGLVGDRHVDAVEDIRELLSFAHEEIRIASAIRAPRWVLAVQCPR